MIIFNTMKLRRGGVIDVHTHGLSGRDTRSTTASSCLAMAAAYHKAGTHAFCPTIYTDSLGNMRARMSAIAEAMELQSMSKPPHPQALLLGLHIEGPFINPARAGALDKTHFLRPALSSLKSLLAGFEHITRIMTIAPELPGALRLIEYCVSRGIRVSMGHSEATFKQALEAKAAGASSVTHLFNAMRGLHQREPGLAGFGLTDPDTYAEVIADSIHLHPSVLRLIFQTKPHNRIIIVSDSIIGPQRIKGVLQGAHAPLAQAARLLTTLRIPGKALRMAMSTNPAAYLGL